MTTAMSLRAFIERQLIERGMSQREFAKFVGIDSSTISRLMSYKHDSKNTKEPTISVLTKLANATHTDLCILVEMVSGAESRTISVTARDIAERIAKLPQDRQELIDALLIGIATQQTGKSAKNRE